MRPSLTYRSIAILSSVDATYYCGVDVAVGRRIRVRIADHGVCFFVPEHRQVLTFRVVTVAFVEVTCEFGAGVKPGEVTVKV